MHTSDEDDLLEDSLVGLSQFNELERRHARLEVKVAKCRF